jgi:putative ABC transport system permease protein
MVHAVLSEAIAQRLHITPTVDTLALRPVHIPTRAQQDAANAALPNASISVERGYHSRYSTGLLALILGATIVTVGAAGISTGLAQADARADHATLLAVGATPRMRRSLAASQALAIAGLGSVLGLISGLVPALAYVGAIDSLTLVMPWGTLALLLLGIPALAAAGAYLVTRSRLPLDRRLAT